MSKKSDAYYFASFEKGADYSLKAAQYLNEILTDYDPQQILERAQKLHAIEHEGDQVKHELSQKLAQAFITPFDREDIALLIQNIDSLTDKIESTGMRLYTNNIQEIRPEILPVAELLIQACQLVKSLLKEMSNFKRNSSFRELIISVNNVEEKADQLFIDNMHQLSVSETDPLKLIAWRDLYKELEAAIDASETVADTVETVVLKNS